jgi:hypothetical protein
MEGLSITMPFCDPCRALRRRRAWRLGLSSAAVAACVLLAILATLKLDEVVFWVLAGGAGLLAPALGAGIAYRMTVPLRSRFVDRPRGVVRLWFRNPKFAAMVSARGRFTPAE